MEMKGRLNFAQMRARALHDSKVAKAAGYAHLAQDATTRSRDVENLERLQRNRPLHPPGRKAECRQSKT